MYFDENLTTEQKQNELKTIAYKAKVVEATKLLVDLGIQDAEWDNITDGVNLFAEKLRQREISVYGKEKTKEEITEEIEEINQEIANLDRQIAEVDQAIIKKKIAYARELFGLKKSA